MKYFHGELNFNAFNRIYRNMSLKALSRCKKLEKVLLMVMDLMSCGCRFYGIESEANPGDMHALF